MKNNNIQKINTIGKIGKIVIIIARVAIGIVMVMAILFGVFALAMPENAITVNGEGAAEIVVDYEAAPYLKGAVEIDEARLDNFGIFLDVTDTVKDNQQIININGKVDNVEVRDFRYVIALALFSLTLITAGLFVAAIFAQKFAAALAACETPFEENVIRRMKHFAYSLIPWAVLNYMNGGLALVSAVLVVLVILVIAYVFSYGAQLQQESDETL